MASTKIKVAVGAGLVASLVTPLVIQRNTANELRAENAALRQQTARLAQIEDLQAENSKLRSLKLDTDELNRLRGEHGELLRLRGEVGLLRRQQGALAKQLDDALRQAAKAAADPAAELPPGTLRREEWADVGATTPLAVQQSALWALREGRLDRLQELVAIPPSATPKDVETAFQGLQSLMARMKGFRQTSPFEMRDGGIATMQVEMYSEGDPRRKGVSWFKRVGDQWQLWMPELFPQAKADATKE